MGLIEPAHDCDFTGKILTEKNDSGHRFIAYLENKETGEKAENITLEDLSVAAAEKLTDMIGNGFRRRKKADA